MPAEEGRWPSGGEAGDSALLAPDSGEARGSAFLAPDGGESATNCEGRELNCGESAAVYRMLLPVVAAMGTDRTMIAEGSLADRIASDTLDEIEKHGVRIDKKIEYRDDAKTLRTVISGKLEAGEYRIKDPATSQYISGLLFALPLLDGDSTLTVKGAIPSMPYVEMTLDVLEKAGIEVLGEAGRPEPKETQTSVFRIKGGQKYRLPGSVAEDIEGATEGDWSSGAMWIMLSSITGGKTEVEGLSKDSIQGDKIIMEAAAEFEAGDALAEAGAGDAGGALDTGDVFNIDITDTPDLLPALALRASVSHGVTEISGAARLRGKECDRGAATVQILNELGARAELSGDHVIIKGSGGRPLAGSENTVHTFGDHRMIMLAAFLSAVTEKPVRFDGAGGITKSYPGFYEEIERLGGEI